MNRFVYADDGGYIEHDLGKTQYDVISRATDATLTVADEGSMPAYGNNYSPAARAVQPADPGADADQENRPDPNAMAAVPSAAPSKSHFGLMSFRRARTQKPSKLSVATSYPASVVSKV